MVLPIFKIRRGVMIICAVLVAMSGVKTLQQVTAVNAQDRLQALHQARKQTVLEAVASLQDRLGVLASHPLITSHLQDHPNRRTNKRPSASMIAAVYAQANGPVTEAYLEQNQASQLLDRLHQQLKKTPAWAAKAILSAPSPALSEIRTLSSLAGFNDITLIDAQTGRVILTAQQRYDLGASLTTPPLASSDLGRFFARASNQTFPGKVTDVLQHQPFIHGSTLALAHAVKSAAGLTEGILIAHISTAQVDRWLNQNGQWQQLGYRLDEQSYLIGPGSILQSQWRAFDEQPDGFTQAISRSSGPAKAAKLLHQPSAAGLLKLDDPWITQNLQSPTPVQTAVGGKHILIEKLPIAGLNWNLVTEVQQAGSHLLLWPGALVFLVLLALGGGIYVLHRLDQVDQLQEQSRASQQKLLRLAAQLGEVKLKHKLDLKKMDGYRAQAKAIVRALQTELRDLQQRFQQEQARVKFLRNRAMPPPRPQTLQQEAGVASQTTHHQAAALHRILKACEKEIRAAQTTLDALAQDAANFPPHAEKERAWAKRTLTIQARLDRTRQALDKLIAFTLRHRSLTQDIENLQEATRDNVDKSA